MILKNSAAQDDLLDLPDCSSLTEKGGCSLLNINHCTGQGCRFIHTTEDEKRAVTHWRNRLLALSNDEQTKIAKKYYGGSMPWK